MLSKCFIYDEELIPRSLDFSKVLVYRKLIHNWKEGKLFDWIHKQFIRMYS